MNQTIYASFDDAHMAEKALGALLDHGVRPADVSIVMNESHLADFGQHRDSSTEVREVAERGITTTTKADAMAAVPGGAAIGLGVGALAGLAALAIPGFGLVLGGGALATAIAGAAGATVAGAVAGGTFGYLKDQGVPDEHAQAYDRVIGAGGVVLATECPSGDATEGDIRDVLAKYGASEVQTYPARGLTSPTMNSRGLTSPLNK